MDIQLSGLLLLNLTSCILGLVVAAILWRYPREHNYYNRLLSASFLFLTLAQVVGILVETKMILQVPHFYRLGNLFGLLFMPLSWLYLRGLLKNQKLDRTDLVHFIPALIFLVDYAPFFLSGADVKRIAIEDNFHDLNNVLRYNEGWIFPPWFHLWFRSLVIFLYWLLQVRMIAKIYQPHSREFLQENRTWIRWLTIYVCLQFFLFSPFFVAYIAQSLAFWKSITIGTSIVLIFTAISLIIQPVILYGIRGWIIKPEPLEDLTSQSNAPILYISKEKLKTINNMLEQLMATERSYLKAGYSLVDLTNDLGIPLYQVSFFLNHVKGKSFHDMLNEYRIEYSRELMLEENNRQLTLEAIAYESGFGNRNSFTTAFKKFTGHTPSAFMKEVKQNGSNGSNGNSNKGPKHEKSTLNGNGNHKKDE